MKNFSSYVFLPLNGLAIISFAFLVLGKIEFNWLYAIFGWVFISGFGVSVSMHRTFSHRAYLPNPIMKKIMLFFATLSCEGSSIVWCALHRGLHHPFSDTRKDPQRVQFNKTFFYILHGWKNDIASKINFRSIPDLLRDKEHAFFHKNYEKIILTTWGICLLISPSFFVSAIIIPTFMSVWLNNVENIISHIPNLGYRNHSTADKSANIWWFHPFGWGGGALHNNHHNKASRFLFSERWFEFDPVIIFLPLLWIGKK